MIYLDDEILITVNGFTTTQSKTYSYKIDRQNDDLSTWTTLFSGNTFIPSGETSKEFYINDIINSYSVDYSHITPNSFRAVPMLSNYRIVLSINNTDYSSTEAIYLAYRYPFRKSYLDKDFKFRNTMGNVNAYNMIQGSLLPRIPYMADNFPFITLFQYSTTANPYKYFFQYEGSVTGSDLDVSTLQHKPNTLYCYDSSALFSNTLLSSNGDGILTFNKQQNSQESIIDIWNHESTSVSHDGEVTCVDSNTYGFGQSADYAEIILDDEVIYTFFTSSQQSIQTDWYDVDFDGATLQGFQVLVYNEKETEKGSLTVENIDVLQRTKRVRISLDVEYNTTHDYFVMTNFKLEYYASEEGREKLFDVANVDTCSRDYYLIWKDRLGGFQSQPFDKNITFSEDLTTENVTNYKGTTKYSNIQSQPKWIINSNWISDNLLPYYESIFVSPIIMLFDSREDKVYNVNVTDKTYTEKTFLNNQRKLFNLQLNLELNKKQNMIY